MDPISSDTMKYANKLADKGKIRSLFDSVIAFFSRIWHRITPNTYDQIYNIMSSLLKDSYSVQEQTESNDEENTSTFFSLRTKIGKLISGERKSGIDVENPITGQTIHL
jgi:hypothetical protein